MKALTLTQPWASLVALDRKQIETRSWRTDYAGPIAIHAAKGWTADDREFAVDLQIRGILPVPDGSTKWALQPLPLGAIVATADLVGIVRAEVAPLTDLERELGDYTPGRFAWLLANVAPLADPIPVRGALGLWEWSGA